MKNNSLSRASKRMSFWVDRIFTISAWFFAGLALLLPLLILGFIFVKGISVISLEFLTQGPKGFPLGTSGGIRPAIMGSLALVGIGLMIAFPVGVLSGIYISEYSKSPLFNRVIQFLSESMAAIPSMVYGLFGYSFLVVFFAMKISLLAGGITLGLIMFPVILIGTHESMKTVEWCYREASMAMGVTKAYAIKSIIFRKAFPGILAATILAAGHAFGSAAPVLYTASVIFYNGPIKPSAPVMTLPTHLYYLIAEAISFEHAYGTALVLISILLCVNLVAMKIKSLTRV
tara:strand:+ start:465 stop:1328 length:864 start_codon:yes stop_codon:yes gene_type:complete